MSEDVGTPGPVWVDSPLAIELGVQIDQAIEMLGSAVATLLDIGDRGDLMALGPQRLTAFAQRFEAHRSSLAAVDAHIVEAAQEERLPEFTCSRSLPAALADILRISLPAAKARVARAEQVLPRHEMSSGTLAPPFPVLAAAVRSGAVTGDQLTIVGTALDRLASNPAVSRAETAEAERQLVEHASAFGPADLKRIARRIDDALLPDGTLPPDEVSRARRGVTIGPLRRDGTHEISGSITRVLRARLHAVLSPLAAPRPASDDVGADSRTPAQRMHDALDDALGRLLDAPGLPRSGGTPATVHLTVDADRLLEALRGLTPDDVAGAASAQLRDGRAIGESSLGDPITVGDLAVLAADALIVPVWMTSTGGVLGYGRERRCATEGQTNALIARDRGCSFPGCEAPPEWCERHHILPWLFGGETEIDNLTLACGHHHREFARRGWQVVHYAGLPVWIPPRWLDADQQPLVNLRLTGGRPVMIDRDAVHAAAKANAARRWWVFGAPERRPSSAAPGDGEAEALDPLDDITTLLSLHIDQSQRDEFTHELALLLSAYGSPPTGTPRTASMSSA